MTKIDYVDETINFVTGCTYVSPACDNCYAKPMTRRLKAMGQEKYRFGFNKVVEHPGMLSFKFPKKPRRYFVNSMSDTFHKDVTFNFHYEMFKRFAQNPQHTFLIFTKRVEDLQKKLDGIWFHLSRNGFHTPLKNVWIIVTAENQEMVNYRLPYLLESPAHIRGVSIEPMLGPIDLSLYIDGLDWVIVGGESGSKARDMQVMWPASIQNQCEQSITPFWFKQWGEYLNGRKIGRKKAGDSLFGHVYKQMPC